jgi:hypothetical protein
LARIEKVARRPLEAREELNRRLANGEPGGSLLRWLNGLPAAWEQERAEEPRESKLVQVKIFHRGGAETPRDRGVGEGAREWMEMSRRARPSDSNLGDFATWRDENGIFGANWGESNQVQADAHFFRGCWERGANYYRGRGEFEIGGVGTQ